MCKSFQASVKWEVINEDDDNKVNKGTVIKKEPADPSPNVAEHDIFGGAVSDSEEEDATLNVLDMDENSQNSGEDSHLTDSNSVMVIITTLFIHNYLLLYVVKICRIINNLNVFPRIHLLTVKRCQPSSPATCSEKCKILRLYLVIWTITNKVLVVVFAIRI